MAAVFGARVGGVCGVGGKRSARVLPDATALIPMETQVPKGIRGGAMAGGGKFQPNPFAYHLGQLVLAWQLCLQQLQNLLRRQLAVGVVFDRNPFRSG